MRQRGNLARLLATKPEFVLMDEPFGALDAQTKEVLQQEFLRIWDADSFTVVYVTHDLNEAALLADRVLVMGQGRIAKDIRVPFPRPRVIDELRFKTDFQTFARHLWQLLDAATGEKR
jgi:NitT/TauT family transport system ATP-binding protein